MGLILAVVAAYQVAVAATPSPQPLADAWWTGPMLAASAATLPRGHSLIEPYLFDVKSPNTNAYGSLTYILYGVTDRFTFGVQPTAFYTSSKIVPSSSSAAFGDTTVIAQYGLTRFHSGYRTPAVAVVVQESLPTGRYDNLGTHPSDGFGSGTYSTTIGLYSQDYFWMGNGRILRARLDLLQALSHGVAVTGVSVYGTAPTFHGYVYPGSTFSIDVAGEYSATRTWVPALDILYKYNANTSIVSRTGSGSATGPSAYFAFAPAIEYNWASNWGALLGSRFILRGLNVSPSSTPALAINFYN